MVTTLGCCSLATARASRSKRASVSRPESSAGETVSYAGSGTDPDNNTPLTIGSFVPPAAGQGTVALNGSTSLTYTPPATDIPLQATFSYIARDSKGLDSEPATVTVNPR